MGRIRDILEDRREVEIQLQALRRVMECEKGARGLRSSWPSIEKVPGKAKGEDEYIFVPRGTNCPEGKESQYMDWLEERMRRKEEENRQLVTDALRALAFVENEIDYLILRRYYLEAKSDSAIARELHFDRSNVGKRRRETVDFLDLEVSHLFPPIPTASVL